MDEIDKIKYHIQLLSEALDPRDHPTASLVISNDWTRSDLDAAHDIFERYDAKLEKDNAVNWHEFEHDFQDRFGIGYQGLKSIVLAFFRNGQWTTVGTAYAINNPCIEFSELVGDQHHRYGRALEDRVAAILMDKHIAYSRNVKVADGKREMVDFLVHFPRVKVAIEVKRQLTERGIVNLDAITREIHASGIADEIWLVLEQTSASDMTALSTIESIELLTLEDLEKKLAAAS